MPRDRSTDSARERTGSRQSGIACFYSQPFASQMMIWATRKRLVGRAAGHSGIEDTLHVFGMAGWTELHGALILVVDAIAGSSRLPLTHVNCAGIARHERILINALADLQRGDEASAVMRLRELLSPAIACEAMRHLYAIASLLRAQGLQFAPIAPVRDPVWLPPEGYQESKHVH
jgi:hypothetical protein